MAKIEVGLIPACGKGNRISELPLTKVLPKPMLPILNKPIIHHVVDRMRQLGVKIIYITAFHKKDPLQEYFGDGSDFGVKIRFILPKEYPPGLGDSIYLGSEFIKEPFIVILGDDFTITDSLENVLDIFFQKKAIAVTGVVNENDKKILSQTNCILLDKENRLKKTYEKPMDPKTNIRGCGIYVFDPKIFSYLRRTPVSPIRGGREITDTLGLVAKEGSAYAAFINGINVNINTLADLHQATLLLLAK